MFWHTPSFPVFENCQEILSRFFLVSTDKEIVTHEGYFVPDSSGQQVARGDVARFMLSLLGTSSWLKKGVAMITK